ncbi:major facilitator superfamily transporter [Colletotrichum scovillei]|uniref:major facilitator superfamily transporter n=1 Tax=Colletotrichum scovillei TaxID=1209932 RepID=UPI0015C3A867|nr:major facilitator superfamily transporter [Colletotrichum scovillei]KAF4785042.1 major facilitator superfamily transporter [Colletotrichum scovillei]
MTKGCGISNDSKSSPRAHDLTRNGNIDGAGLGATGSYEEKYGDAIGQTTSDTNTDSIAPRNAAENEKVRSSLVRKFDHRLVPAMFLAHLLFFLDKSNIALARINGLERDLKLVGNQFNTALAMFFILNILFNIPGNLAVRRVGGAIWLPALIISWGIVTTLSGLITNFVGLCITRAFLGLTESSFLGGVLIYLGFFYTADELILRMGLFYSSTALAGFLGGLMAAGIGQIKVRGYDGWPWIFFIEGALTILLGVLLLFTLPHTPADARFLSPNEKTLAVARMQCQDRWHYLGNPRLSDQESAGEDGQGGMLRLRNKKDPLTWKIILGAMGNVITILMALGSFCSIQAIYSFSMFLPTIISAMGYRKLQASLMTAPPNFAALLFTIGISFWSRRSGKTALPLNVCSMTGILGYIMMIVGAHVGPAPSYMNIKIQYAGSFFVAMSVNATPPLALTWMSINASPHYVRAVALGFLLSIGNSAAFLASFTYIKDEAPRYLKGHFINFGCLVGLLVIGIVLPLYMKQENKRRSRGERDFRLDESHRDGLSAEEHEFRLGWMHPSFRFKF